MVVESDGYNALIEYFIDNLSVFSSKDERVGSETIDELVHELVASQIMLSVIRTSVCLSR